MVNFAVHFLLDAKGVEFQWCQFMSISRFAVVVFALPFNSHQVEEFIEGVTRFKALWLGCGHICLRDGALFILVSFLEIHEANWNNKFGTFSEISEILFASYKYVDFWSMGQGGISSTLHWADFSLHFSYEDFPGQRQKLGRGASLAPLSSVGATYNEYWKAARQKDSGRGRFKPWRVMPRWFVSYVSLTSGLRGPSCSSQDLKQTWNIFKLPHGEGTGRRFYLHLVVVCLCVQRWIMCTRPNSLVVTPESPMRQGCWQTRTMTWHWRLLENHTRQDDWRIQIDYDWLVPRPVLICFDWTLFSLIAWISIPRSSKSDTLSLQEP